MRIEGVRPPRSWGRTRIVCRGLEIDVVKRLPRGWRWARIAGRGRVRAKKIRCEEWGALLIEAVDANEKSGRGLMIRCERLRGMRMLPRG